MSHSLAQMPQYDSVSASGTLAHVKLEADAATMLTRMKLDPDAVTMVALVKLEPDAITTTLACVKLEPEAGTTCVKRERPEDNSIGDMGPSLKRPKHEASPDEESMSSEESTSNNTSVWSSSSEGSSSSSSSSEDSSVSSTSSMVTMANQVNPRRHPRQHLRGDLLANWLFYNPLEDYDAQELYKAHIVSYRLASIASASDTMWYKIRRAAQIGANLADDFYADKEEQRFGRESAFWEQQSEDFDMFLEMRQSHTETSMCGFESSYGARQEDYVVRFRRYIWFEISPYGNITVRGIGARGFYEAHRDDKHDANESNSGVNDDDIANALNNNIADATNAHDNDSTGNERNAPANGNESPDLSVASFDSLFDTTSESISEVNSLFDDIGNRRSSSATSYDRESTSSGMPSLMSMSDELTAASAEAHANDGDFHAQRASCFLQKEKGERRAIWKENGLSFVGAFFVSMLEKHARRDNFHFEMRWVVWVRLVDDARTWRKKGKRQATWKDNEMSLVGVGLNKRDGN
ncbi:hypothetical protein C8J57DRAFT_1222586 [Mycena rebaudengoi]|nr:hypothetical protein C8J57DRAFT_1222586 [Mycena rebaudengoi]